MMRLMNRGMSTVILVPLIILLIAGAAFAGGGAESAETGDGVITLNVWATRDNYVLDLDDWYAENPNIRINYEVVPWERQLDQLLLVAGTNRAPDVSSLDFPWVPVLGGLKHLLPLDDYIDKIPASEINDFNPAVWDFVTFKGVKYAYPFTMFGRALYYRADWFEDAGLSEPETWDDVIAAAKKLQDPANDIWGLSVRGKRDDGTTQGWLPIFHAMGGEIVDEIPQLDSPAGIRALELYRELVWDHEIMSPDTVSFGSGEARGMFISGQAVMSIIGSHIAPAVVRGGTDYPDFKLTHIPRLNRNDPKVNMPTSYQWAIMANSQYPDEAMKFIRYLSRPEGQKEFNISYMEAVRDSVYEMPEYKAAKPWSDFIQKDQAVSRPLPKLARYNQMSEIVQDALQEMLGNPNADASAVAAAAQQKLNLIER
ncbi:MAG: sugar ABC transporter substrate-binding protein [Sedimentisphaerales bacterium]|nr:sugar ABC transporter substrate-binding protein [Sedimentisphaerales bacterium]